MYEYKAKLDRIIDGDTVDCFIDLGFNISLQTLDLRKLQIIPINNKNPILIDHIQLQADFIHTQLAILWIAAGWLV